MLIIFLFSAQPSSNLPDFQWLDRVVKKGGHTLGYALLAAAFWRGFNFQADRRWLVWLLTLLYAISDETHQAFVPGRNASALDAMIFDNLGALLALGLVGRFLKQTPADPVAVAADKAGR